MEQGCVRLAYEAGINYFFFYNLSFKAMAAELPQLLASHRQEVVVATGSESRDPGKLQSYLEQVCRQLDVAMVDVFYAEYVSPQDDVKVLLGSGGVFETLHQWKAEGLIRYVGATTHNRPLAVELIQSGQIDVLMHRYNMAHRGAQAQVLPAALQTGIPVVAFTCTRWASLLKGHPKWERNVPSATDCYRYVLRHPAIHLALTAPATRAQLEENLAVLREEANPERLPLWEIYGQLIYGDGTDPFETEWL